MSAVLAPSSAGTMPTYRGGLSLVPASTEISTDTLASAQALAGLTGIGGEAPAKSGGCGCSCAQARAGGGALGGVDAPPAPAAIKPVKVDKAKEDKPNGGGGDGGGGGGGGGGVSEFKAGTPKKLSGETSHGGLTPKSLAILGGAQAAGLKLISGVRPGDDGGHGNGSAVDIANVPGGSRQGSPEMKAFAESVRAAGKAGDPNVGYVIYEQKIASARDGWAWRPMADRGSNTANHFDHVHVSTDPAR